MSSGVDTPDDGERAGIERIEDPDDYTARRRLRQLHDARDAVREIKDEAFRLERSERAVKETDRDRFVAERLADYVAEVAVVVETGQQHDADEFLATEVAAHEENDRDAVTLRELRDERGLVGDRGVVHYQTAMRAWTEVNRTFERIAGAEFETSGLPRDRGFNSVDGGGEGR